MYKQVSQWMTLAILLLLPLATFLRAGQSLAVLAMPASLESAIRDALPGQEWLRSAWLEFRLFAGEREQDGIFISEEGLMRRPDSPSDSHLIDNTAAISAFVQQLEEAGDGPGMVYFAVIPTSVGVLQQHLPRFAQSGLVDQQRKIEEIHNQLPVSVRTVDVYSTLKSHSDAYIYYRTDNSLTALGGYYVYSAVARRMGIHDRTLDRFSIDYVDNTFYGDLYQVQNGSWGAPVAPYRKIEPDVIALYRYQGEREYMLRQRTVNGRERVYHTLYPLERMQLDNKLDVYLGGNAAVTEITSSTFETGSLLVFGDRSANMMLPFMSSHYRNITLVNLFYADNEVLDTLRPEQYDTVLFAYEFERFCSSSQPAMVRRLSWPGNVEE